MHFCEVMLKVGAWGSPPPPGPYPCRSRAFRRPRLPHRIWQTRAASMPTSVRRMRSGPQRSSRRSGSTPSSSPASSGRPSRMRSWRFPRTSGRPWRSIAGSIREAEGMAAPLGHRHLGRVPLRLRPALGTLPSPPGSLSVQVCTLSACRPVPPRRWEWACPWAASSTVHPLGLQGSPQGQSGALSVPWASPGSLQVAFEVFDLCSSALLPLLPLPGSCFLECQGAWALRPCCLLLGPWGHRARQGEGGVWAGQEAGGQEWPIGRVYRSFPPVLALGVQVRGVDRWILVWAGVRGMEDPSSR